MRVYTTGKLEVQYIYSLVSNQKVANIVYSRTINTIVAGLSIFVLKNWKWEVESYRSIQPGKNCIFIVHKRCTQFDLIYPYFNVK